MTEHDHIGSAYDPTCDTCVIHDETCGKRCEGDCGQPMCLLEGPIPRACMDVCEECSCRCDTCFQVQQEMRAELVAQIAKEADR